MSVKPIETPDYIPSYDEMRSMSRKLSMYFSRQAGWMDGKSHFMHGMQKKSLDKKRSARNSSR